MEVARHIGQVDRVRLLPLPQEVKEGLTFLLWPSRRPASWRPRSLTSSRGWPPSSLPGSRVVDGRQGESCHRRAVVAQNDASCSSYSRRPLLAERYTSYSEAQSRRKAEAEASGISSMKPSVAPPAASCCPATRRSREVFSIRQTATSTRCISLRQASSQDPRTASFFCSAH